MYCTYSSKVGRLTSELKRAALYIVFYFIYKDLDSTPCFNLNTVAYFQYQVTGHINITSNSLVHLFWMFLLGINVISLKTNKQAKTMKLHSLISLGYFKGYVHLSQTTIANVFFFLICDHVLSIIYMVLCKQVSLEK